MSLQVWLPLNGSLENLGLADTSQISTTNLSFSDNGKIGKCLTGYTGYFNIPSMTGKKQLSVAYWIRINTATSTQWLDAFRWYSTDGSTTYGYRNEFYNDSTRTGVWYKGGSLGDAGLAYTVGTWRHHAFTIDYETGEANFYINGVRKYTISTVDTTHYLTGTNFMIGENGLDTSHNDVRIYDHILSEKEVKELSKGLVAHYPLNDGVGGENLLKKSEASNAIISENVLGTSSFEMQGWVVTLFSKTWMNNHLTVGETYTLSFKVTCLWIPTDSSLTRKEVRSSPILVHQGTGWNQTVTTNDGVKTTAMEVGESRIYHITFTFAMATESAEYYGLCGYTYRFADSNNANVQLAKFRIDDLKLEKGSIATPWIPATSDDLYSAIGLDEKMFYDCSGYRHNATVVGDPEVSTNSPRYSVATYFNGSSYARTLPGEMVWSNFETLTVTAWIRPTVAKSGYSGSIGITHNANADRKCFAISNYGGKFTVNTVNGTTYVNTVSDYAMPLNEWHHYAATLNNGSVKMYIDGELVHTATIDYGTATLHPEPQINIAVDLPGSDETYIGDYSDIRIYCTALSADDIKALYETSASIDDKGNFHAYEISEV